MDSETRVMTWLLGIFDCLFNFITLGAWQKLQGEQRIAFYQEAEDE
jgi:hypothetical protein